MQWQSVSYPEVAHSWLVHTHEQAASTWCCSTVQHLSDPCILQSSSACLLTPQKANYSVSDLPKKCCHSTDVIGIPMRGGHSVMGTVRWESCSRMFRVDAFPLAPRCCCLFCFFGWVGLGFFPAGILTWTKQWLSCQSLILFSPDRNHKVHALHCTNHPQVTY